MSKLYIAVLDKVPDNMVPVLVAHAILTAHLKFYGIHAAYDDWLNDSYRKVVLKVNEKEFAKILNEGNISTSHENTTLNSAPSCIVLSPRDEYPNVIKFAKLWQPNSQTALDKLPPEIIYHYDL